ncbi:MAG: Glu-tRNA(Gln) amidotransferase subunit GatE [Methanocellales archaeon]|nr:Glu-tRNA(Gln) amidotransferase subunit GatE [Methanocellales archaeon]
MLDYRRLGLRAGLEIHQQLDTKRKLFCNCPTRLRSADESTYEIRRGLHLTESELGEIDRAALEEARRRRLFIYKGYDTTCLVENDEEPPQPLNQEALDVALEVALLLNMTPVNEVHTMRKIVIDGSNTSGFQRTAFVASNGKISTSDGDIGIATLCLEEEAAQKVAEDKNGVMYSLDRLGIPLVEIATKADITTPKQARIVAEGFGMMLRSTGKVKRGIGTIRQDINISIAEGARAEIKGVQALNLIEAIVEREVLRQVNLLKIRDELKRRGAKRVKTEIINVSDVFASTKCGVIKKALKKGVFAVRLPKFGGLVGQEIQPGRRFGAEFADRAKRFGIGGVFHTDELLGYGITNAEVTTLKKRVHAAPEDCVIFVAGERSKAALALEGVVERANMALKGVPEETRRALEDGNSAYMRPLPGAARMYPETDVLPVPISQKRLKRIKSALPELFPERRARYIKEYALSEEFAGLMSRSSKARLFERIVALGISPTLVVRTLEATTSELSREGVPVQSLKDEHFMEVFKLIKVNRIAKEGIPLVLRSLAANPSKTAEEVALELGLRTPDRKEIESIIDKVVQSKEGFIRERGLRAVKPLMGVVMKQLRGKADGRLVNSILKEKITAIMREK